MLALLTCSEVLSKHAIANCHREAMRIHPPSLSSSVLPFPQPPTFHLILLFSVLPSLPILHVLSHLLPRDVSRSGDTTGRARGLI